MNVLITGAESRLGKAIAEVLAPDHRLRLWSSNSHPPEDPGESAEWFAGDMRDPDTAWNAMRGIRAVIHTGEAPTDLPENDLAKEQELLDLATRGTHVLFQAGVAAGVKKFVYGSTLKVFESYPDDVYISEMWKPEPSPEMFEMTRYLGEFVCREFARDNLITATTLRLGKLVSEDEVVGEKPDLMWLDYRDAAQAFSVALRRDDSTNTRVTKRFLLFHVCARIPNAKYLVGAAQGFRLNGFAPQHIFEGNWSQGGGS